jgi:hypothetical protein
MYVNLCILSEGFYDQGNLYHLRLMSAFPSTVCAQGTDGNSSASFAKNDIPKEKSTQAAGGIAEIISAPNSTDADDDESSAWNSSAVDCSDLSHFTWTSDPPGDLPINRALLSGAKALLQANCMYSEPSPDYLPSSYTELGNNTTNYLIHAIEPSHVYWRLDGDHLLKWESQPGSSPPGWSAVVTSSDIMADHDPTEVTQCFTDCSGLMTALHCYANIVVPTIFKGWRRGSSIPEAGCHDPFGGCQEPNPVNHYRFFDQGLRDDQGRRMFQETTLNDLMPGDIIAYANASVNAIDTGHVMLAVAVADIKGDPLSRLVAVIDEIGSPHSCDTRKIRHSKGIGMGVIKLTLDKRLEFFWKTDSMCPLPGATVIGRAL